MGNAHQKPPFRCPICDHDEYATVKVRERPTEAYQCASCTTVFKDIDRFTKYREPIPKASERRMPPIEPEFVWPKGSGRRWK